MPLYIVKQDELQIKCDAIVNFESCSLQDNCKPCEFKVEAVNDLPYKYVIQTFEAQCGADLYGKRVGLKSCYKKSLEIAKEYGLESIAFPFVFFGENAFKKKIYSSIATRAIRDFLRYNEMDVYLVIQDKSAYGCNKFLYDDVKQYVEDNLYNDTAPRQRISKNSPNLLDYKRLKSASFGLDKCYSKEIEDSESLNLDERCESFPPMAYSSCSIKFEPSLLHEIESIDESFAVKLLKLIDKKGMSDVECYKKANVSKQTWYKIMNEKNYKPSKNTVLCFAIALSLSLEETKALLGTVGFALSKSIKFDVIIEYFIKRNIYDIFSINETLFEFDEPCLGV